jgi:uncharacterized protein YjbI with pentapeptide repeats
VEVGQLSFQTIQEPQLVLVQHIKHIFWQHLEQAHLQQAHLQQAHLQQVHLQQAHLEQVRLEAHLEARLEVLEEVLIP